MTSCELCRSPATMFCESDQASLCWVCDSKVHSANFLVARHSRSLLCQVCQSPTPWSASGAKLGQTVSVCKNCVGAADRVLSGGALFQLPTPPDGGGSYDDTDEEDALVVDADDDDSDDDEVEEEAEEGDGTDYDEEERENQVEPWSSMPPPPVTSSSSSEESSNGFGNGDRSLKRKHEGRSRPFNFPTR